MIDLESEVKALRAALERQQQDLYALQQALDRLTEERDRLKAELTTREPV